MAIVTPSEASEDGFALHYQDTVPIDAHSLWNDSSDELIEQRISQKETISGIKVIASATTMKTRYGFQVVGRIDDTPIHGEYGLVPQISRRARRYRVARRHTCNRKAQ